MNPELAVEMEIELTRTYLEGMEKAIIGGYPTITKEEARAFIAKMREVERFETMMMEFIQYVVTKVYCRGNHPDNWHIIMSSQHRDFVRQLHQRYQWAKIYRGGKEPSMGGIRIFIDNTVELPRLVRVRS